MPVTRSRLGRPAWAVAALLVVLAAGLAATILHLRHEARVRVEAEVQADIVAIDVAESTIPVVQTLTMLDRQAGGALHYVVADAAGTRIAGSLGAWPAARADARGWIVARDGGKRVLGRTLPLDRRMRLFVGRDMTVIDRAADRALLAGAGMLLLALSATIVAARRSQARLERRLRRFDDALIGFVAGDEDARIGDTRRDALGETAGRIDDALARLAGALRVNRRLAGTMAHEIIRPVAHAALAVGRAPTLPAARAAVQDALESARAAATALLQREPPVPSRADLADLARRVAEPLLALGDGPPPILLHLSPAPIAADAAQATLLIANLVENALRHAGSAGPVELSTSVDGAGAILCVADRGAGAAALPRDATGAPCGGGRHGLDLVRDIARRQDAELSFTDRAGGGLLVRCRWPG